MTGRARARSRGRGRGQEPAAPGAQPSVPPEAAKPMPPPSEGQLVGRGRQKPAPGAMSEEAMLQISAGFQQVKIGERGGRRRDFHDSGVHTRQLMEHYHVDFKPPMESRRLRSALLFQHEETLGKAHTFDGAILFLPNKLHNTETVLCSETRNGEKVEITVTLTNELPPSSPVCLQFYNIMFRRILRILNMQQIGRHYYNPDDPFNIPQHRLTIWPGFVTTILQYESSIMLCTDVSHKVLRSETVLDFMYSLRQQYNNKTYRIDDIAWDHTPNNTFKKGDTEISFKNYFKTQYGLDITDGNQVLLVSHVKRLGPSGLTDKMRADFNIMKDLASHTRLSPEQRESRINRLISNINRNADVQNELTTWGLSFENRLLSLNGRVLPSERIIQGGRAYEYNPWTADWTKEMRGLPLISCMSLDNWLMFYTRRNADVAQSLLQTLNKVSGPMGIRMQRAVMIEYEDRQESLLRALQQNVARETQMVVVILPTNRKDKYDCVKKYLCVDCPTPSQCVVSRTISKPQALMTVATKIALQMNCKMGGELWSVEIPLRQLMIVGIDCYHDTAAGKRSIGALVATALKAYLKYNNSLPSRIIVYRDGVGDGMLRSVVDYEVPQIMQSIKTMGQDYEPKLSVVVVKKRISSRFFARIDGKIANPPPGTVIDTEVTRPEWYDFFIVSQAVRFGCVAPTHYNVVFDNSGLKPDHMQRLTYKLCHMYYNWQGIVRVPAPCQYAHKLAFLVGQSIHKEPNMNLDDFLYYLCSAFAEKQDLQWTLTLRDRKGRVQSTEDNRHFNDIVMRDRLADLNGGRQSASEDGGVTVSMERDGFMQDFFRKVEEIRGVIGKISSLVNEVKKKHSVILSAPNPDETMQQNLPTDEQMNQASVDARIQKTQYTNLSRKFVEVMTQYSEAQVLFREKSKSRIQRQLEITGRITTNEELEEMLETGNPSIFISDIISDSQITRQALNEIESRHKDILRLDGDQESCEKYIILALIVLVVLAVIALIVGLSVGLSVKTTTNSASSSSNAANPFECGDNFFRKSLVVSKKVLTNLFTSNHFQKSDANAFAHKKIKKKLVFVAICGSVCIIILLIIILIGVYSD
ncbi:Piwi-like protein 1 [Labeo rohita]|uniref:Piwi-like protein 1 n=2 Tax=Labeonini TaxID=2743697 RepID=A0ABQ8MGT6_LABRO|nr:Piwi-like protein 1 [Labeo rohita]